MLGVSLIFDALCSFDMKPKLEGNCSLGRKIVLLIVLALHGVLMSITRGLRVHMLQNRAKEIE